jgi:hypothetical protein
VLVVGCWWPMRSGLGVTVGGGGVGVGTPGGGVVAAAVGL